MTAIITLSMAFSVGTQFIVENHADRGDTAYPRRFLDGDHGPLWLMPEINTLKATSAKISTFPMCAFNAPWQKCTSLMIVLGRF